MSYSVWFILGFILLVAELFAPSGFYLFVFGLAGLIMGTLRLIGLGGPEWVQFCTYGVIAMALLLFLRKKLLGKLDVPGHDEDDSLIGEEVIINETIEPQEKGKGEARGSVWQVKNCRETTLERGQKAKVVRRSKLMLEVE